MRKWILLTLLALVAVAFVGGSKFFPSRPEPVIVSQAERSTDAIVSDRTEVSGTAVNPPRVAADQLIKHIQALNFKRYTDTDRQRTRDYLIKSLKQSGWSPTLHTFDWGVNVLATRQGTDPEAGTILVAAHYDSVEVSPGADDNATGVAVVLEVARLLGSRAKPRTLQLAFFDSEERGLLGSIDFVGKQANLTQLKGVVVLDMVGYACHTPGCQKYPAGLPITPPTDRGDFLAVIGDSDHLPLLDAFQKSTQPGLPAVLALPVPLKGMLTPDLLRSDHAPFWYQGVGAVLLTDTANLRTPHYHQPSDTPTTLDQSFFVGAAQIVVNATTRLLEDSDQLETQSSTL